MTRRRATKVTDYDRFIHYYSEPTYRHGDILPPGWYFSDESYDYHGPFSTRAEAIELFNTYVTELNSDRSRTSSEDGPGGD
jgi:hypothetical protein